MSKAAENRKKRRKRDKKFLLRLAHKIFDHKLYQNRGVNGKYYDVVFKSIKTKMVHGRRVFDILKMNVIVKPNARYAALIKQLVKMCGDVKVVIPKEYLE